MLQRLSRWVCLGFRNGRDNPALLVFEKNERDTGSQDLKQIIKKFTFLFLTDFYFGSKLLYIRIYFFAKLLQKKHLYVAMIFDKVLIS